MKNQRRNQRAIRMLVLLALLAIPFQSHLLASHKGGYGFSGFISGITVNVKKFKFSKSVRSTFKWGATLNKLNEQLKKPRQPVLQQPAKKKTAPTK